ncbi:MAG: hypothetical protein JWM56_638 [Candidatus Peribacteria bacterium]|nr:hypothetical protein [Candidatus Peribacteria bacterium]
MVAGAAGAVAFSGLPTYARTSGSLLPVLSPVDSTFASGSTKVMVMTHVCNASIQSEADFQAVEAKANGNPVDALVQTVLACPTVRNPGNEPVAGTATGAVAGPATPFAFDVLDRNGVIHPWSEGVFSAQALCESDVHLDANGDGTISADTCLDISHDAFTVPTGAVTVLEKTPPAGTRFGTLRLTPAAFGNANDTASLLQTYPANGAVFMNTNPDTDHMVMLHVYNFMGSGPVGSSASGSPVSVSSVSSIGTSSGGGSGTSLVTTGSGLSVRSMAAASGSGETTVSLNSSVTGLQHFTVMLSGNSEVPPVPSSGSGDALFTLSGTSLLYMIHVHDLSSAITAAHFHRGAAGSTGVIIQPIAFEGTQANGTWVGLTRQDLADLLAGNIYVNVHTVLHPGGEIRSQLQLRK